MPTEVPSKHNIARVHGRVCAGGGLYLSHRDVKACIRERQCVRHLCCSALVTVRSNEHNSCAPTCLRLSSRRCSNTHQAPHCQGTSTFERQSNLQTAQPHADVAVDCSAVPRTRKRHDVDALAREERLVSDVKLAVPSRVIPGGNRTA